LLCVRQETKKSPVEWSCATKEKKRKVPELGWGSRLTISAGKNREKHTTQDFKNWGNRGRRAFLHQGMTNRWMICGAPHRLERGREDLQEKRNRRKEGLVDSTDQKTTTGKKEEKKIKQPSHRDREVLGGEAVKDPKKEKKWAGKIPGPGLW